MSYSLFADIGIAVAAATILAILFSFFRQPTILGYIFAGLVIGPVLGVVKDTSTLSNFSELGIALLLFVIGIELDIKRIRQLGVSSLIIGALQVALTAVASYFIAAAAGFAQLEAVYLSLVVSFSSTLVVVKLLSDKNELDSLHGELVLGILIVQDLLAVFAMAVLGTIGNFTPIALAAVLGKGALLIVAGIASGFVLNRGMKYLVTSKELLFIFGIAVCMAFAALASFLSYSLAIGAFIAGIILGNTTYNFEIAGRVKPLRDFFLTLFFVALGMQLRFDGFSSLAWKVAIALLLVLLLKPVISFLVVKLFRFGNRTALLSSLQLAQVSEFSLIIVAAGAALGHISSSFFTITALLTMVTFAVTAYAIKFDNAIYTALKPLLRKFEKLSAKEEGLKSLPGKLSGHVVVFGIYRMGNRVIGLLQKKKEKVVVVDYNPEKIARLLRQGISGICSDMTNWEIDEQLHFREAKAVISTIRDKDNNLALIGRVRGSGSKTAVVVAAFSEEDAVELYQKGADYVVLPEQLGGEHVISNIISKKKGALKSVTQVHLAELRKLVAAGEVR